MSLRVLALRSLCSVFAAITLQAPAMVSAGPNQYARILLHLTTQISKNACSLKSTPPDCSDIDTSGELETDYFAYVILSNVSSTTGIGAVRFGITYDDVPGSGVDIASWNSCGSSFEAPYPEWPAAGTGILLTWDSSECLPTVVNQFAMFVTGYFQLNAHTADELRITRHPGSDDVSLADCGGISEDVLNYGVVIPFGWAVFTTDGTAAGSNPCGYDAGSCHISGPDSVGYDQTGIQYGMKAEEVTPYGSWSVYGNAQIINSNNSIATVNPTAPGTFWIRYTRSDCVEGCGCQRQVKVFVPTPVERITWGRLKAGLLSH